MIFGDLHEAVPASKLQAYTRLHLRRAETSPSVETTRSALIAAGVLEQAYSDTGQERALATTIASTDAAAAAFLAAGSDIEGAREAVREAIDRLDSIPCRSSIFDVRPPEGFAFHALFPEQYAEAANQWAAAHHPEGTALVIGIRSIGTTLSAVVAEVLRRRTWKVRRTTVRPFGPPSDRGVTISQSALQQASWVLIVDEGPGLSGSSMASVALACEQAGMPSSRIAFFSSHSEKLADSAPEDARSCFKRIECITGASPDLSERLAIESERIAGRPVKCVENWSAGAWRGFCYESSEHHPPTCAPLERTKYRCCFDDGSAHLWKFAGFPGVPVQNAGVDFHHLHGSYTEGWTPEPLGVWAGFVAQRWVAGRPASALEAPLTSRLLNYLFSGPEWMTTAEAERSHRRLRQLVAVNLRSCLGGELGDRALRYWERAKPEESLLCRDPQLSPHEWIVTPDGQCLKTDSTGHLFDSTVLGRQPIEWGIAAACNGATHKEASYFLRQLEQRGSHFRRGCLLAYRLANIAYRLGVLDLARTTSPKAEQPAIEGEKRRICELARWILT